MRTLALWTLATVLFACAIRTAIGPAAPDTPPRITFDHELHLNLGPECGDCHADDGQGRPQVEFCQECHSELDKEEDRVQAYYRAIRQPDGTYAFPKLDFHDEPKVRGEEK